MSEPSKPDVPLTAIEPPLPKPEVKTNLPPEPAADKDLGSLLKLRSLDDSIEKELEAAMDGLSDKDLYGDLSKKEKKPQSSEAAGKKGKVLSIHGTDVFVQVPGGRSGGVLPLSQFPDGPPAIGAEVDIHIERYDEANGLLILSRRGAAVHTDWSSVAEGMIVEARVTGTNKGGLSVEVNSIRGFMPISQIDIYRVENVESYINQRLTCLVTDVDKEERNLVVSRRALIEKEREENREKLWNELAEGQVRSGVVRSVREFGAFVDLGGVDGLLHVSEMSWNRVQDPNQIVQLGQTVKVVVLKIDREKRKLSLGLKQLTASPWDNAGTNYLPNTVVKGTVTRLMDFGAFVELEPGVEGLVHISELAPQRVRRVADVVQTGQEVHVMVLRVDTAQKRISLSLKAALPKESTEPTGGEGLEEEIPQKPPRPRTAPLRGGIGSE
ncbi:MAG TPA: S1 RNA-binding domain-containing protein [Gemmataceae bacterium]|nr:S1 RNA-binding domain-containing protein [Gemmataceae bacterium]